MKKAIVAVPFLKGTGGTETVIKNFAQALDVKVQNNGISWKLISFGGSKETNWQDGWMKKVYNFTNSRYIQLIAYMSIMPILIANILKKEKPDYFIATNPMIWTIAYKSRKILSPNTQIIAWYHYSFKMKHVKKIYLKYADKFWAISNGIRQELLSMDVPSKKIQLVYNPVALKKDTFGLSTSKQQINFIYIGRIDYDGQKNVSELIKALNKIKGNWHCDLYGSINKNTKDKLLDLANAETKKKISFKGFYKDVWNHINKADVLILTSKYEGLGMVLIEAASRGIALVSSDCPMGPSEIVNSSNGFLYKPGDVESLADILDKITSKKISLPEHKEIKDSVQKFGYKEYSKKILTSLN